MSKSRRWQIGPHHTGHDSGRVLSPPTDRRAHVHRGPAPGSHARVPGSRDRRSPSHAHHIRRRNRDAALTRLLDGDVRIKLALLRITHRASPPLPPLVSNSTAWLAYKNETRGSFSPPPSPGSPPATCSTTTSRAPMGVAPAAASSH